MTYFERKESWLDQGQGIPGLRWMNRHIKNHLVAALGEYVGTLLFLFFAFAGTQIANTTFSSPSAAGANPALLLYISLSFGFSLAVNAWVFYRVSGGLFNPAVTLGMVVAKALPPSRALFLVGSQLLGAMTSAGLVSAMFPGDLNVTTKLESHTSVAQGLFIEMFLTIELMLTIFMLAAEKTKATFLAPVGIGLSLFVAELAGVYFTGGSLNPARSFGPCVVNRSFEHYHWIYWLGPCMGSVIAAGFYKMLRVLEYEAANPGQDEGGRLAVEIHPPSSSSNKESRPSQEIDLEAGPAEAVLVERPSNPT